jgi:hypothetical protein
VGVTPPDEHDDEIVVWPFRRQLVDRFAPADDTVTPSPAERPPVESTRAPAAFGPAPQRPGGSPLRYAVPVALVAFCAAIAGTAAIGNTGSVQEQIQKEIGATPADAAKPKARPRRHAAARKTVFVPDVVGLDRKHAAARLGRSRFRPRVRFVFGKPGLVLEQKPAAATQVEHAGRIVLVVGKARPQPKPVVTPTVIVTSVVGLPRDRAVSALRNEGLGIRIYGVRSARPAGTVVAQAPRGGTRADSGSYVRVNVAAG